MAKGDEIVKKLALDEDYVLCIDKYQFWIVKPVVSKNGKESLTRVTGYYKHIDDCLYDFFEHRPAITDNDSMKKLLKTLDDTRKEIKRWRVSLEGRLNEYGGKK